MKIENVLCSCAPGGSGRGDDELLQLRGPRRVLRLLLLLDQLLRGLEVLEGDSLNTMVVIAIVVTSVPCKTKLYCEI